MVRRACHRVLGWLCVLSSLPAAGAPVYVPSELDSWRPWVLQDQDFRQCPFLAGTANLRNDSFRCAWPERLTLTLDARGGTFSQRWQLSGEAWITVPGDEEHWPVEVRVDGNVAQVVAREKVPQLHLSRGEHLVAGAFRFGVRPEQLAIDPRTVLVDLTLDGRPVAQPERPDGALWLGNRRSADQPQRTQLQVYRLVHDQVPVLLTTLVRLRISGPGREEVLGRVLPEGFTPVSLESELPARLEPDGQLRAQLRAGSWDVTLVARGTSVASELRRPAARSPWPEEEVWSFQSEDRLRVAAAEGPQGVDPAQANVPEDWSQLPAFRMTGDSVLRIVQRTRGLENADDNSLQLDRQLWLDFDAHGWTAVDRISGTMLRDWRLEMPAPWQLQSARAADERVLLVTRNPGDSGTGIEVRSPEVDLNTAARLPTGSGSMPATGWHTRFVRVSGVLNLPPGHRLIAVIGADRAPEAWLERWRLWGVFGVLVVAAAARWIGGWRVGLVALTGLLLTYQEAPDYVWLWGNALIAVALTRAAPEGRLRRFARGYRFVSFVVLGIALLPFLLGQLRLALYPQLQQQERVYGTPLETRMVAQLMPPPLAASPRAAGGAKTELKEEVIVTGSRRTDAVTESGSERQYATGTVLQAGPGIPNWHYLAYGYSWTGAVEPGESVRFLFVGPLVLAVWRIAGVALMAALFIALLLPGGLDGVGFWIGQSLRRNPKRDRTAAAVLMIMTLAWGMATPVRATSTPDGALLEQLKARLTRPPDCLPTCADIASASVAIHDDQLDVSLAVTALAPLAVAVPGAGDRWQLTSVSLDGKAALAIGREGDGTVWVPVTPGVHTILLAGRLAASQAIQLAFPLAPHRISVTSKGWDVSGLNEEQRLISGSLELVDRRGSSSAAGAAREPARDFPVFVAVTRTLNLGLTWGVRTTVERVAPQKGAVTVEIPLLGGESVLSQKMETHQGPDGRSVVVVGLDQDASSTAWTSVLAQSRTIQLAEPPADTRTEVWKFVATPQWNLAFNGIPAVLPDSVGGSPWTYEFYPRPGEKLEVAVTRPAAAEGSSLALDAVEQYVLVGKRSTDSRLRFAYRSTQGGRHAIQLPQSARVTSVALDGKPTPLRPERGELSLGLLPGAHSVQVEWTQMDPIGPIARPAAVDLQAAASNVTTQIAIGPDRWPLLAFGAGVGPVILYWGEAVVFLVIAMLLGRWSQSPLRTHEWVLLGIGLSTLSWSVLALVAAWLFALRWRRRWPANVSRWRFNLTQIALALLTVVAVAVLVFAGIRQSLLASPDMGIAGDGSAPGLFAWFVDRTASTLPRPAVISVPLWLYRVLMFAWAFWIATALLRWLRGAWEAWKTQGIWRSKGAPVAAGGAGPAG